jgi:tRNA threonylcarbamoyladenosine biosynthesis protein TsaE
MNKAWISNSEEETANIAVEIANSIQTPAIICLNGDMGAGKTAFSRAFIRHIMGDDELIVPSPTYTLAQTYADDTIWHFDLYRLDSPEQLYDIGWEEALDAKLCLIEWPQRLGHLRPSNGIDITIEVLSDTQRQITCQ